MLYSIFRDANTRGVKQLLVMLKNIPTYGEDNMSVAQKLEEQGLHQGFEKAMKAVEKIMQSICNLKASLQRLSKIVKLSKQLEQEEV